MFNIRTKGIESPKRMLFVFALREVVKLMLLHLFKKMNLTLYCPVANALFLEPVWGSGFLCVLHIEDT